MQIYERTRRELEKETRLDIWEQKNKSLRIRRPALGGLPWAGRSI